MYEQYIILYYIIWGPPVGDPTAMYAPPLRYKREALAAHASLSGLSGDSLDTLTTQARIHSEQSRSQPLESTSNTTHSGRRVLRSVVRAAVALESGYKGKDFIPCWTSKGRTYRDVESGVPPESA